MSMPAGTIRKTHCKRGHARTPDNVHKNGTCKQCQKDRLALYHKDHPEKQQELQKKWRTTNPTKARAKVVKWRSDPANKEKEKVSSSLYRANNLDKIYDKNARYRKTSEDKVKAASSRWKAANKDRVRDHNRQRRAVIIGAKVEEFSSVEIFNRDGWICGICGEPVSRDARFPDLYSPSLDHIIPLSKGGDHSLANCQLAHLRCNMSKGDRCK